MGEDAGSLPKNINFKPFSTGFIVNPYPTYALIQNHAPTFYVPGMFGREWIVTRYEDVLAGLKNRNFVKVDIVGDIQDRSNHMGERGLTNLRSVIEHWMFFMEPPQHGEMRRLLSPPFTSARVKELKPTIDEVVDVTLARLKDGGYFDILEELAAPVAFKVMCRLLGCTELETRETLNHATELFKIVNPPIPFKVFKDMEVSAKYFVDTLNDERIMQSRDSGLFGQLCELCRKEAITTQELVGCMSMLLSVGQDTTKHLVGNVVHGLYTNRHQLTYLRDNTDLLDNAIFECGRHNAPVSVLPRIAQKDCFINDFHVKRGERVFFMLGAAHRDRLKFDAPDVVDINRGHKSALLFGSGIHFCLGYHLSMSITKSVIERLIYDDSFSLNLESHRWMNCPGMRGLTCLEGIFS